jgi:hypothetical protein
LKEGLNTFINFLDAVNNPSPDNYSIISAYVTEEGYKFAAEVSAGISTIEHQKTMFEVFHTMSGKANLKRRENYHGCPTR